MNHKTNRFDALFARINLGLRAKLVIVFLLSTVIPIMLFSAIAWHQVASLGDVLRETVAESFARPRQETLEKLTDAVNRDLAKNWEHLAGSTFFMLSMAVFLAFVLASYLTNTVHGLIWGISRFRAGERHFRFRADMKDELGTLANAFNDMADSIVESVSEPLSIIDMNHRIIYMNAQALELVRGTLDGVIGRMYEDISVYPHGTRYCPITALLENREADVLFQPESGHYYKGTAHYLLDKDDSEIGYIIVTNDVTEIEDARLKAEQASLAKSSFLSNMSHEMRTPLNAIIGMTSIGVSGEDIEKKDYALRKIQDASTHLLGVINDILDMSKIEANKFVLSFVEFSFEKMLQRVVDVINFRVDEKHQSLTVRVDPAIPGSLLGDDQRLSQVITNLLSNAVKFTSEEGSIRLEAELSSAQGDACTLLISVKDSGIGLSDEQKGRLFTSFGQAETSTSRKYGGTGLGLAISKNIVEMMSGRIWVESELGQGADFSFTVRLLRCGEEEEKEAEKAPAAPEQAAPNDAEDDVEDFGNFHILLAEDVEINREIVLALLEPARIQIDCAENGREAVEKFTADPLKYDLIFMDVQMPEMDGYEATKRIRESGAPRAGEIPIVAMTANVFREDVQKCLESGMDAHVGKPLDMEEVFAVLDKYLKKAQEE